jgi:hypothetical protein
VVAHSADLYTDYEIREIHKFDNFILKNADKKYFQERFKNIYHEHIKDKQIIEEKK